MTIFLDLDGVLVDFVQGALKQHGATLEPDAVRWDFLKQIGVAPADFWRPLGFDFWAHLPWTREGKALLAGLPDNVVLLSSPCQTNGCCDGKRAWVNRELPQLKDRLILASCKEAFAHPGALLIDDHEVNVDKFRAAGGRAVLVPRPWNRLRASCDRDGNFDVASVLVTVEALRIDQRVKIVASSWAGLEGRVLAPERSADDEPGYRVAIEPLWFAESEVERVSQA